MKFLSMCFLLVFLFSCASSEEQKSVAVSEEYESPVYMTKDEVMAELANPTLEIKADLNDEEYKQRLLSLAPMEDMFKLKKGFSQKSVRAVDISTLPEDVDLRIKDTAVKSQGSEGTCTAFGLTAVQEATHCSLNQQCNLNLSERHRWNMYKKYSADVALGTIASPIAPESICPYSSSSCPATVKQYAKYQIGKMYRLSAKSDVLNALAQGKHVYFWSQTPSQMVNCSKTISSSNMSDGGHAYKISGYFNKADPILIVKNSWGSNCADNGFQYMKFSVFDKAGYWGAASMDSASILGNLPDTPKCEKKCEYLRKARNFWVKKLYCWQECK